MSITVKITYNDDIRRLSLPDSTTFSQLQQYVASALTLKAFGLKYLDDEGDRVMITSDEELHEAFRLAQEVKPSVLRVFVGDQAAAPSAALPPQPSAADPSKTYPPLDVSEWDAPAKTITVVTTAPLPGKPHVAVTSVSTTTISSAGSQEGVAVPQQRIAQQMVANCVFTSNDVSKYSRDTCAETVRLSNDMRAQLYDTQYFTSTSTMCNDLSRKIADECRLLSIQTAQLSRQLATEGAGTCALMQGSISAPIIDLSVSTARMCRDLSQATRQSQSSI